MRDCVSNSRTISSSTSHKLSRLVARPIGDAFHDLHLQSLSTISGTCNRAITNDWRIVHIIETTLYLDYMQLMRSMLQSSSRTKSFYTNLMNLFVCRNLTCHDNLLFVKHVANDPYSSLIQRKMRTFSVY